MGTAFSYQGFLSGAGTPTTGTFDFIFSLYDSSSDGNQIGQAVTNTAVIVNNGLFLTTIDFGNVFDGNASWLALGVRTNGSSAAFTALTPLQMITPTPYSIYASNASGASPGSGSVSVSSLNTTGAAPASGDVLGYNGSSLVWVSGGGGGGASGWSLTGNAGTTPGVNFLGTLDNNPIEFHVYGTRALQLIPTGDAPSVVGGAPGNYIASGMIGSTIAGGGTISLYGQAYSNSIFAYNATIGGGLGNAIRNLSYESTIAGGNQNLIQNNANDSYIGGGRGNIVEDPFGTIGGGEYNEAWLYGTASGGISNSALAAGATIAGGGYDGVNIYGNYADAPASAICGGIANFNDGDHGFIGGGNGNRVLASGGTVGGGAGNSVNGSYGAVAGGYVNEASTTYAFVGGGFYNLAASDYSTIGGGNKDVVGVYSEYSTIGGGNQNEIGTNSYDSVIAGGAVNTISQNSFYSAIAGGQNNFIAGGNGFIGGGFENTNSGDDSVIAGGIGNFIPGYRIDLGYATGSTISGGGQNLLYGAYATISGGHDNALAAANGFIGGGFENTNEGDDAVIAGGSLNGITQSLRGAADGSTISGGVGNAITAQYATISGGATNNISANYGVIGGGEYNRSGGLYSSVPGGFYNAAYGTASFAAGEAAEALSDYSFVWSDGTYLFDDQGTNTFNVLASGGTYIYSGLGVGVVLDANRSSWTTISDRNKKKNFKPVDCEKVLEKLVAMPIQQWNYKWEKDTDTPNLGPMAQDFKPAFYPGRDEKGISTLEFDGVELAAIQGLNQKLEERDQHLQAALKEKDAKIAQLEKALADLESSQQQKAEQWEARFEKLQKLVASLADKPETSLASASAMNPSK
jgi:hypothetical protein